MWAPEEVPDEDLLYYRVHGRRCPGGVLNPNVFVSRDDGMSTDWCRYSTPYQSLQRARKPSENGLVGLPAGMVRATPLLTVRHDPIWVDDPAKSNRAHTLVVGPINDDSEIRVKLARLSQPVIAIPVV